MSVAFLMGVYPARGLAYALSSDGTYYIVTGIGNCTDTELIIPNKYRGKPVQEISANAFYQNASITSLHIPASLRVIGELAFGKCTRLQNAYFEDTSKMWLFYDRYDTYIGGMDVNTLSLPTECAYY